MDFILFLCPLYGKISHMKKIYWCLQQLQNIGGTEFVTTQIISFLSDAYEIHLIPFSKVDKEKILYKLPPNVIIEDLGFPSGISQFDINFMKLLKEKHFLKAIKLLFLTIHTFLVGRNKYRKKIEKLINKEDLVIVGSSEIMVFMPKNRYVVQHFHYNSALYYNSFSRFLRLISPKPNYYIFLTQVTYEVLNKKHKFPGTYISNPCRFENRIENFSYKNNSLIAVCRLEAQKDPMMFVKIAKELKDRNFNFTLNIFGNGTYKEMMQNYIDKNELTMVKITSGITDLTPYYLNSDLNLMTSKYEGVGLNVIEGFFHSVPALYVDMGDPTRSVIEEGKNGYIIEKRDPKLFADYIIKILSNQEKLEKLKRSTYEIAKQYEVKNIKEKRIKTLDTLFENLNKN